MQRRYLLSLLLALFLGAALSLNSCEDPPPYCETQNVGDITIVNKTGYWFYFALDDYNDFKLYDNGSKTYYDEESGIHYFYVYDDLNYNPGVWLYQTEHLSACEDLNFTWYLNKKKSTEGGFYLEISRDGLVVKTISEFKIRQK